MKKDDLVKNNVERTKQQDKFSQQFKKEENIKFDKPNTGKNSYMMSIPVRKRSQGNETS